MNFVFGSILKFVDEFNTCIFIVVILLFGLTSIILFMLWFLVSHVFYLVSSGKLEHMHLGRLMMFKILVQGQKVR
jgi:hypothetical protein